MIDRIGVAFLSIQHGLTRSIAVARDQKALVRVLEERVVAVDLVAAHTQTVLERRRVHRSTQLGYAFLGDHVVLEIAFASRCQPRVLIQRAIT